MRWMMFGEFPVAWTLAYPLECWEYCAMPASRDHAAPRIRAEGNSNIRRCTVGGRLDAGALAVFLVIHLLVLWLHN
ncbi:ORF R U11 [Macacine gammaherpesvirus 5]|nr:ORF R U11 [Macacine gammaherpesvirus 5]